MMTELSGYGSTSSTFGEYEGKHINHYSAVLEKLHELVGHLLISPLFETFFFNKFEFVKSFSFCTKMKVQMDLDYTGISKRSTRSRYQSSLGIRCLYIGMNLTSKRPWPMLGFQLLSKKTTICLESVQQFLHK